MGVESSELQIYLLVEDGVGGQLDDSKGEDPGAAGDWFYPEIDGEEGWGTGRRGGYQGVGGWFDVCGVLQLEGYGQGDEEWEEEHWE